MFLPALITRTSDPKKPGSVQPNITLPCALANTTCATKSAHNSSISHMLCFTELIVNHDSVPKTAVWLLPR